MFVARETLVMLLPLVVCCMCTSKLSSVLMFIPTAGFVNSLFVIADASVTVSVSVSSYI